jgi:glycogen synthase
MEESKRPPAAAGAADDPDAFFAKKRSAKLAFQEAKGLVVGLENRLLVFMGRITHQKGCGKKLCRLSIHIAHRWVRSWPRLST